MSLARLVFCVSYFGGDSFVYRFLPKFWVPFWGVPLIRIMVFWGLYRGTPVFGDYHIEGIRRKVRYPKKG